MNNRKKERKKNQPWDERSISNIHKIGKTNEKKERKKEIERRIILFYLLWKMNFFLLVSSVENPSRCSCLQYNIIYYDMTMTQA